MESPEPTPALEAELAALRAANADLTTRLARLESALAPAASASVAEAPAGSSRRDMLKVIAGAAGGAVAATVFVAQPAAAADGQPLLMGQTNTATSRPTRGDYTGGDTAGVGFLFQAANDPNGNPLGTTSQYPSALAGWAGVGTGLTTGVYGYTSRPGGNGVVGFADTSDGVGVRARGGKAGILITGSGIAAPPTGGATHSAGEIQFDQNGDLWACVADGTPGTWRKLAGPSTAGAFHAITPIRVYDSRVGAYTPSGLLSRNENRVVAVKDARSATGVVTGVDAVPAGASAVAYNLTVTGPQGANYLSITPGDATGFTASAINFNGTTDVANGGIVKLDASRQVKVFCGDQAGKTHFILDVTGYFR
jgi:hypothetical protein